MCGGNEVFLGYFGMPVIYIVGFCIHLQHKAEACLVLQSRKQITTRKEEYLHAANYSGW